MAPPVLTDARKFALTATYTAAAQTDILLATEKQYVSTQRNDRSRLSRNPRSRDENCDRRYGEEELVQPGDDGPAFGGDDPSRQGREPVGGSALRRRGRLHGRSRHAEVLRAEGDRKAASRGLHRSVRTRESLPQTASHCSAGHLLHCGIEIALAGDIIIAADTVRFCQMESKRGIAPLGGAHFRYLTRAGWGDAMYHLFLCDEFNAERAYKIGLVQEVVPLGRQVDRAMEVAQLIAKNAPLGIQITKQAALKFTEAGEKSAIEFIPKIRERVMNSEDMKEGIQSFIERRAAVFKGR